MTFFSMALSICAKNISLAKGEDSPELGLCRAQLGLALGALAWLLEALA